MSIEQTPVEPVEDDLDLFSAELFGQSKAPPAATEEETEEEVEQEDASTTDTTETDALEDENDTVEDEVAEEPTEKPKKNRFQERIDKAVGAQREAERQLAAALAKLEAAEKSTKEPKPTPPVTEDTGPQPTDTNEDGTEKYPLGEFDPLYIKDLMRHTLKEESVARERILEEQREQAERDQAQAELQSAWNEKLVPAKERYPDFQEVGEQMLATFENIDPAYGEYLTNTIMEMEYGPDVFYYLASNVDEAQKIVDSGPKKATLALGRLETKFATANEVQPRSKVSKAPPPPAHTNKGAAVAMPDVPDDTDDLDAFAKKLFKRR
jgi:hypothetical protein